MKHHGGFEHNLHSLRIVEELEEKYPAFPTEPFVEVLEGLAKHQTAFDRPARKRARSLGILRWKRRLPISPTKSLITATTSTTASTPGCCRKIIWHGSPGLGAGRTPVKNEHGVLPDECRRYFIIRTIIDLQIRDVVETSERLIQAANVLSATMSAVFRRRSSNTARAPPAEPRAAQISLQTSLLQPGGAPANQRAVKMLKKLFEYFLAIQRKSATAPSAA